MNRSLAYRYWSPVRALSPVVLLFLSADGCDVVGMPRIGLTYHAHLERIMRARTYGDGLRSVAFPARRCPRVSVRSQRGSDVGSVCRASRRVLASAALRPLVAALLMALSIAPAGAADGQTTDETIVVDGALRTYLLHVPPGIPTALVIACHGGGSNGPEFWDRHWHRQSGRGAIIICPTARIGDGTTQWIALGDQATHPGIDEHRDERYILALRAKHPGLRAYLCGFSSGAKMTHHLFVTHADSFSGFGMRSSGIREAMTGLTPSPRPVRFIMGTADDNFLIPGDGVLDALATMRWYTSIMPGRVAVGFARGTSTRAVIHLRASTPPTEYVKVEGMPHRWPTLRDGDPFDEDAELMRMWGLAPSASPGRTAIRSIRVAN